MEDHRNDMEDFDEVPEGFDGYEIPDVEFPEGFAQLPEAFRNINFNKETFAKIVHEAGLTRKQAQILWNGYTKTAFESVQKGYDEVKAKEVERAKQVEQLNEKIEGASGYNLTPEEAQAEIDRITSNPDHAYWSDKAPRLKRDLAVAYVTRLYEIVAGQATSIEGYLAAYHQEQAAKTKQITGMSTGSGDVDGRSSSNGMLPNQSDSENGGMPGSAKDVLK